MQFVITIAFLAFSGLTLALPTQERTEGETAASTAAATAIKALVTQITDFETEDLTNFATKVGTGETAIAGALTTLTGAISTLTG